MKGDGNTQEDVMTVKAMTLGELTSEIRSKRDRACYALICAEENYAAMCDEDDPYSNSYRSPQAERGVRDGHDEVLAEISKARGDAHSALQAIEAMAQKSMKASSRDIDLYSIGREAALQAAVHALRAIVSQSHRPSTSPADPT